jgi:hypothetical protein
MGDVEQGFRNKKLIDFNNARKNSLLVIFSLTTIHALASRYIKLQDYGQYDVGDWLINYSGGFVRRGLFGEVLLHVFKLDQPIAGFALFLIQSILIVGFLIFLFKFIASQSYSYSSIALCCSPAVGLFISNNYGLTRKELLGIFSLILLTLASRKRNLSYSILSWISILMFGLSCFSSEINALLLPAFLYVIHVSCSAAATPIKIFIQKIALVLISFVSFGLSSIFHGNSNLAQKLCQDVISHGFSPQTCTGTSAISWLGRSTKYGLNNVREHFPLYLNYIPLILLASIPILLTPWFRTYWRWCLACVFSILPLYVLATDYGRWTFMLATEISVMVIATKNVDIYNSIWNRFTTLIFIFGWGMPLYVGTYFSDAFLNFIYRNNALYVFGHFIFTVMNRVL